MSPHAVGIDLVRAAPHVRLHRGKVFVVKVGGGAVARANGRERLARQLAVVAALGSRVALVHGAGPQTDALLRAAGEEPRMVDGRRVTSDAALRALAAATAELNAELVAALDDAGVSARTVPGADALVADRRPPVVTSAGRVDFGRVGDLRDVDPAPLAAALDAGAVPVLGPPASDGAGGLLNVNADLVAAHVACALGAAKLVLLTGAPGVLADPADAESHLSALSLAQLDALEERGAFERGMRVKAAAIRAALRGGVGRVHVVSGEDPGALLRELYTNHGAGTLITREPESAPMAVEQTA